MDDIIMVLIQSEFNHNSHRSMLDLKYTLWRCLRCLLNIKCNSRIIIITCLEAKAHV
jgi:hypothetical protein